MPFINVLNKTVFSLQAVLIYVKKGSYEKTNIKSDEFQKGSSQSLFISDNTTNITLKTNYKSEDGHWLPFISINLPEIFSNLCFEVSGDLFNQSILNCNNFNNLPAVPFTSGNSTESNMENNTEVIKVKNNEMIFARMYISYSISGSEVKEEDIITIIPLGIKTISIPMLAKDIYLEFQASILSEDWKVINSYHYATLTEKNFIITSSSMYNNSIEDSHFPTAIPNNEYIPNQETSYITIQNRSKFIVKVTLQYGIRGEPKPVSYSVLIAINKTDRLAIPYNAALIYLTIESKDGRSIFKDFYMSPENHCFKVKGSERSPAIKEIIC